MVRRAALRVASQGSKLEEGNCVAGDAEPEPGRGVRAVPARAVFIPAARDEASPGPLPAPGRPADSAGSTVHTTRPDLA